MDATNRRTMTDRVEASWTYLRSWCDAHNRIHGVIATYWDSSETCTAPHVMNHFPVVEGLRILHDRFNDTTYLDKASGFIEFVVDSYDPSSRLFENAWGDLPGKDTGVVHQAAAAGALLDVYALTGRERYLGIAVDNLKAVKSHWPRLLLNGVANQVLKYIQAVARLKALSFSDYKYFENDLNQYRRHLERFFRPVAGGGGLFDQSVYSCLLMTVYEAKCLHGLKALADAGIARDWAVTHINKLVKGLIDIFYVGKGIFLSHCDYAEGIFFTTIRYGSGALRRFPWPDKGIWIEELRRFLLNATCNEIFVPTPIWLARLSDLAFAFNEVNPYLEFDISSIKNETIKLICENQLQNGGVPNCAGPWMSGWHSWERLVCSSRWNAYVFRLFCSLSTHRPELIDQEFNACRWGDSFVSFYETENTLSCLVQSINRKIKWDKPLQKIYSKSLYRRDKIS